MTLEDLTLRNEKFQRSASQLAELLPGSNLISFATTIIRSSKKVDLLLRKVLSAKSDMSFYNQLDLLEEEIDELIYLIDRLDEANKKRSIGDITAVIKGGYELISLYSICCDQILERKTKKMDEQENE